MRSGQINDIKVAEITKIPLDIVQNEFARYGKKTKNIKKALKFLGDSDIVSFIVDLFRL